MQTVDVQNPAPFADTAYSGEALVERHLKPERAAADIVFDLWAWTSGLASFLHVYDRAIGEGGRPTAVTRDRTPEFYATQAAFERISNILAEVHRSDIQAVNAIVPLTERELVGFSEMVQDMTILNGALLRSDTLGFGEWKTWRTLIAERLLGLEAYNKLDLTTPKLGEIFLPANLRDPRGGNQLSYLDRTTLLSVASRLSRILRSLRIISRMLHRDEPLKPCLLIFCSIYEQIRSLTEYINNILSRSKDEQAEFYGLLDGASYMASLELKKAYNQELAGIVGLRSAPSVYARVESAYALLNDSFQEILTSFARLLEPGIGTSDLFPEFQHKLAESLLLRSHLSQALAAVQSAEQDPAKERIENLRNLLKIFLSEPVEFLFYKDRESVERFCEEVHAANDNKDLVPILHRFAAYLETLFRQVSMRTVLSNHPFEPER